MHISYIYVYIYTVYPRVYLNRCATKKTLFLQEHYLYIVDFPHLCHVSFPYIIYIYIYLLVNKYIIYI